MGDPLMESLTGKSGYNPNLTNELDASLMSSLKGGMDASTNPSGFLAPNANYNVTDESHINKDDEALQGWLGNAFNSFKQGIDMTQLSTYKGQMEVNALGGDGPAAVIDNYKDDLVRLQNQLAKGTIKPQEFANLKSELDSNVAQAHQQMDKYQADIDANQIEINNEPVSKEYQWKQALTQSQGDQASVWDKLKYSAPNVMGSSAGLMVPTLAATFGANVTKALLKSSAAYVLGPEAGAPANLIATVGAIGISLAELAYGRYNETLSEVSGTVDNVRAALTNDYMKEHNMKSLDTLPEGMTPEQFQEDMRQIRIKSRKGAQTQFWENMALTIPDVAGAILMPLGTLGSTLTKLGKFTEAIDETFESARNYNKLTRLLSPVARMGLDAYGEKFEEGFQFAADKRAQDLGLGAGEYTHGHFLKSLLTDSYDTASSLNYSLLPGIDLRGNGRYSDDKEFQFSENSGGMLGMIMGGLPTAISISKDMIAYRQANKDLQNNGLLDIDGKYKRLQTSLMTKYFDNGDIHHIGEAIKSMVGKKDESGNPLMSESDAHAIIDDMKETYDVYKSVGDKIDSIGRGKLNLGVTNVNMDNAELTKAKKMVKEDFVDAIVNMRTKKQELSQLEADGKVQYAKDQELFEQGSGLLTVKEEMKLKQEALDAMEKRVNILTSTRKGLIGKSSSQVKARIRELKEQYNEEMNSLADLEDQATALSYNPTYDELSPAMRDIYDRQAAAAVYLSDYKEKVGELSKVKTSDDLRQYALKNISRVAPDPVSTTEDTEDNTQEPQPAPAAQPAAPVYDEQQTYFKELFDVDPTKNTYDDHIKELERTGEKLKEMLADVGKQDMSFPELFDMMSKTFASNPQYLKDNFSNIQGAYWQVNNETPLYRLNPDMTISQMSAATQDEIDTSDIPPTQGNGDELNKKHLDDYVAKVEEPKGSGDKIVSGLSLAQRNLAPVANSKGELRDMFEGGKLVFSYQHDQQLGNTNMVAVGDTLKLAVANLPKDFNAADTSDENYDKVEIGVYKEVEIKPGVTKNMLLFHLHRIDALDRLLSDTVSDKYPLDIEAEKTLLRVNRRTIIEGGTQGSFECKVLSKGFGRLNKNAPGVTTTIANVVGSDTRPVITYVDANGDPVPVNNEVLRTRGEMVAGATIILLPNEVAARQDGTNKVPTVFVPVYLTKKQLKEDTDVLDLVYDAVASYLKTGRNKDINKADPYVFITTKSEHKLTIGMKGIYASNVNGDMEVQVNNRRFTADSMDGLKEAIAETYFTVNRVYLKEQWYQDTLKKSPLVQTNVTANPVLLSRYNNGIYSFLEDNQQYSYFSQHTVTIGSIVSSGREEVISNEEEVAPGEDDFMSQFDNISFDEIDVTPLKEGKLAQLARKLGAPITKFMDDISQGAKKKLLVSPEIPASLQHEMVKSIAFNMVKAERPEDDAAEKQKNIDRVKAWVKSEYNKYSDGLKAQEAKGTPAAALEPVKKVIENYRLMNENIDALVQKSTELIESLGYKYDEDSDYYENLEGEGEENDFVNFADDANSTRDQKEFLPKEVKKLLYFIPALRPININDKADKAYVDAQVKANKPAPTYREIKNTLLLPTFNNFNDTWEKTLEITTSLFFDATNTGFEKMLDTLLDKNNAPVVQELAKELQKATEQVQNAFFRRTKLQKQVNKSSTYDAISKKRKGTLGVRKFMGIFDSDRKQGTKATMSELQQEFLTGGQSTGILVPKSDEATGSRILTVDQKVAQNLSDKIEMILNNASYFQAAEGRDRGRRGDTLTEAAKKEIHLIVKQAGINLSYEAFDDLLRMYRTTAAGSSKDASVIREVFVRNILGRLAGKIAKSAKQETEEADESIQDDLRANDPFRHERRTMEALARFEAKYRQSTQSGSYYFDGKSYYAFTRPNYLSDFFTKIKEFTNTGTDTFIKGKLADVISARSIYLNGLLKKTMELELSYELGSRNKSSNAPTKLLKAMNPREHEVTKLAWYQNKGEAKAYFLYDTLSDKSTKPVISARKFDVSNLTYTLDGVALPDDAIERVYNAHFLNEYERINKVFEQNRTLEAHEIIKGYHDVLDKDGKVKKEGLGKRFLTFYFLNKAILDVTNPHLSAAMYQEDETLNPITGDIKTAVKDEISKHFNKVIQKNKKAFQDLGLYDLDATYIDDKTGQKRNQPDVTDIIDHNYFFSGDNSVEKRLGLENSTGMKNAHHYGDWSGVPRATLERIVDYIVSDYVYNYVVFSNEMLLITGDPAQAGKPVKEAAILKKYASNPLEAKRQVLLANIDSTFVNLNKRNAAFLASGEGGKFKDTNYNVGIAEDMLTNSEHIGYYLSLFGDAAEGAYGATDKMTDAQEFTTVKEFLTNMQAYGMIDEDKYTKGLYIFDRDQYNQDLKKNLVKEVRPSASERFELFRLVMQPQKPVQRTYNVDPKLGISKQYYIKTSAFPLIPDFVTGSMKDMLDDMKANDIQRVAFVSGVKQGVAGAKKMLNDDGTYNKSFFENNKNTLHRNGFRIQLEVPFKEDKNHIREGTQQSKLLFVDTPDSTVLNYRGENTSAGELKTKYIDYHREIIEIQRQELLKEIGVTEIGPSLNTDLRKLASMLQREGEGRGYALNSLLGLDLTPDGQFKVPLTFLPNAGQIEPVITALLSNNITRLKMPGKSYVQGSEFMLKTGRVESDDMLKTKDARNIIWTKPEYEGMQKLQYLHKDAEGNVKHAQIIMPFYFIKKDAKGKGKMIDVSEYSIQHNGRTFLDTTKVDPELLQMNGFRIPFQGLNSGMWFEIVGFLPYTMGDLVIVPAEIAGQMGSDYDVDKLYSYMYNYTHGEDGRISKVDNPIPKTKEELQNALIDIQKSIYTSSDEEIHKAVLEPLSFDDMEETVNTLGLKTTSEFLGNFDPVYQREVYFSNVTGKLGTAISANANTSHAMAQGANLFIKGEGILFNDEQGNPFSDFMTSEGTPETPELAEKKSLFDKALRGYLADFGGYSLKYYNDELHAANNLIESIKWTDEFKASEAYKELERLRDKAFEIIEGEDKKDDGTPQELMEAHNAIAAMMYHLVTMIKGNNKEDAALMDLRIKMVNDNAVNDTYKDTYEYYDDDLDDMNDNNMPMDKKGSKAPNHTAWRLDKIWTFPDPITGKRYRISNLISQVLGISVDNAKEQKLGALGINRLNFNVALTILRTGFSPNYMAAFINQPILKEYYEKIGETEDIYKVDYTPNKRDRVIEGLFQKYSDLFGITEDIQNTPNFQGYKLTEMVAWLKAPISRKNAMDQLYILKAFLKYKESADGLQALTSTYNVDAKGLPKNMSETAAKQEQIANMSDSPILGNVYNYKRTTIPGLFLEVPTLAVRIFMGGVNPIFAYNSQAYRKAIEDVMFKIGRVSLDQEKVDKIHNNIKEFVYSGFPFPDLRDVRELRQSLLLDTPGNESLQSRFLRLRDKYPRNELFGVIKEVGSIYPDNPKLLDLPMSSEEDFVQKVSEYWENAIYMNPDIDVQNFAKDLVKYAIYVNPKEYGLTNIIRYVPFRYREEVGFHQYLRTINARTSVAETFQYFADQFIEHNEEFLSNAKEEQFMPGTIVKGDNNTIESFTLPAIVEADLNDNPARGLVRKTKKEMLYYPEYLVSYNNKEIGKQIYRGILNNDHSMSYFRIEKKGMQGMSEYNMNREGDRTLVDTQRVGLKPTDNDATLIMAAMGSTGGVMIDGPAEIETGEYLSDKRTANEILSGMIHVDNNIIVNPGTTTVDRQYARLFQEFAKQMQSPELDNVAIILDNNHPTAATVSIAENGASAVIFNPARMVTATRSGLSQELEKQRIILHEFLHVKMNNALRTRGNTAEYRALKEVWNAYKENIWKESDKKMNRLPSLPVSVFDAELFTLIKNMYDDRKGEMNKRSFISFTSSNINDPKSLHNLMEKLGERLSELHKQGKIANGNFDLVSNKDRAAEFKDYIVEQFMDKLDANTNKYYAYFSIDEFVTDAMTNRETQELLRKMPSIWQKLVSAIKDFLASIFNIESDERTLFDDSVDAIFNFLKLGEKGVSSPTGSQLSVDEIDIQINELIEQGFIKTKCK